MIEESCICNSIQETKFPIYRSIQIPCSEISTVNAVSTFSKMAEISKPINIPYLPFYWKLNNLNKIITIKNPETIFKKTKLFIENKNILFEFNSNCFNCTIYDKEIQENINFNLHFWNKENLNKNEILFEFHSTNRYNFNNIFRIYDIYNSFCVLFNS